MDKKYQVFISSTFTDLKEERQLVSETLLDMNCIPTGMELFPAVDTNQMDYIQKVIDLSDYYILIIGGRYGSTDEQGISFTEREYLYAKEKNIPILAFINSDIGEIKSANVDQGELAEKLRTFKETVSSGRLVRYWSNKDELARLIMQSVNSAFQEHPRDGWTRGTTELSSEAKSKIIDLQEDVERFRKNLIAANSKLTNYEQLSDREIELNYTCDSIDSGQRSHSYPIKSEYLIRHLAPTLALGFDDETLETSLVEWVRHNRDDEIISISAVSVEKVKLFLQVFEIIEEDNLSTFEHRHYIIAENKKYLLKSAFQRLDKINLDFDDDIPF